MVRARGNAPATTALKIKRFFKTSTAAVAIITCCLGNQMPAKASLAASLNQFCLAIKDANELGLSGAPGTRIAIGAVNSQPGLTSADYRMAWTMAKSTDVATCQEIY